MQQTVVLLLVFACYLICATSATAFNLILNEHGQKETFRFVESTIFDSNRPFSLQNSSIQIYSIQSNEYIFSHATLIEKSDLFAIIQLMNYSYYEIFFQRQSLKNNSIVKYNGQILHETSVEIQWHSHRQRRAVKTPKKTEHIYLNILVIIDSLIVNDFQKLRNGSEYESIEILKLYYIHLFIGVEQLYRQSLVGESFDLQIRLPKIVFATDKYRLPWELYKNFSSISNPYRKSANQHHLRPNVSMKILRSLQLAYQPLLTDDDQIDHIMTFTRLDLIDGAGSAFVDGLCSRKYKYSIVQEDFSSFLMMITVAHELGHNLGLNHDETENRCRDPKKRFIMSPKNDNVGIRVQMPSFSKCSIGQLKTFLKKTKTTCWKDRVSTIEKQKILLPNQLGQLINLRQQCQLQYGLKSIPSISFSQNQSQTLYDENICKQLRCFRKTFDEFIYWMDGAFDGWVLFTGTPCGNNRICHQKRCLSTKEKVARTNLDLCPYGDLSLPISLLNLKDRSKKGNILCAEGLNILRANGMNITYLCYHSDIPFRRLCCEECKKHRIPECGDQHFKCPTFAQYCQNKYIRINGQPITQLCPYTCGKCSDLSKQKPVKFTEQTCIDRADCSQLIKLYGKQNKKVKNWCRDSSTKIRGRYFHELCPKYCSLCNLTSECDRSKLCRNHGKCIRDEHGTYQCLCSSRLFYGTLCEYRRTCLDKKACGKKTNSYCVQTLGEEYLCVDKDDREQIRRILNQKQLFH